jgi:hypothetical protein
MQVGKLAVDRRLDGGNEARKGNRAAAEPPITENDGDQSQHENTGEDFAADMGAVRGQFLELDLNRLGNALHQRPAAPGQRQDRPATLGSQLDDGTGNRLVRFTTAAMVGSCTHPSARLRQCA